MTSEIYPPGVNPVRALYELWHLLLQARSPTDIDIPITPARTHPNSYIVTVADLKMSGLSPSTGYGAPGFRIGVIGHDIHANAVLGYGRWGWSYPHLVLCPDGRFMFGPSVTRSRKTSGAFTNHTFLERIHSPQLGMRWVVNPEHWMLSCTAEVRVEELILDWRIPMASISNNLIQGTAWWMVDEAPHTRTGWEIVPAPDQSLPARPSGRPSRDVFDAYDADFEAMKRRRRRLENRDRVASGLPKLSERPGRLRDGRQVLEGAQAAARIAEQLQVTNPVTTTPLRRKAHSEARKEAHHDG